jgi:hypothetical protein
MRFEDDFDDLPRRLRLKGVSPAWRVVGILTSIAAGLLLLVAIGLGVALIARQEERKAMQPDVRPAPFDPKPFDPALLPPNPPPLANQLPNRDDDPDPEPPNPPYPIVADLQEELRNEHLEKPQAGGKPTPRDRFAQLGQEVWASPPDAFPQQIRVSSDGKKLAYTSNQLLMIGDLGGELWPAIFEPDKVRPNGGGPVPRLAGGGPVGNFAWSDFGRHLYFVDSEGGLDRYELATRQVEKLPFYGDDPLPVPMQPKNLIFRRSRAVPKFDAANGFPEPDPTEVVMGNVQTREVRVLIPESRDTWTPLAVSPDGKWLVLSSNRGVDKNKFGHARLFLLSLTWEKPAEPKPIGPACTDISSVAWELDSASFICARGQEPVPPDCYASNFYGMHGASDLFRYDVDTGREIRLSRGGGFTSPVLDENGQLLFASWKFEPGASRVRLLRAPLPAVSRFAEREPNLAPRDVAAWSRLFDAVLKETGIPADARGERLTPDVLAKLADVFAKQFREQFATEPPTDVAAWGRVQQETWSLEFPPDVRRAAVLVMGACQGEYLCREHGAVWHVSAGPLRRSRFQLGEMEEGLFGYVLNPFQAVVAGRFDDDDEEWRPTGWLTLVKPHAQGRRLILANDHAAGMKVAEQFADPALERARQLFGHKQADEAERLLLDLLAQEKHAKNEHLAEHVASLLHEHGRFEAMRQVMEPRVRQQPPSPQKCNLLGLALLETEPKLAIVQFKTALRYNLHYGSAYLNLAQAYEKTNDHESAILCLKRYLKLMPYGALAQDVRQRLALLKDPENRLFPRAPGAADLRGDR